MGPADYVLHIVIPLIFSCQEGCEVLSIGLQVCSEIAAQSDFLVGSNLNLNKSPMTDNGAFLCCPQGFERFFNTQ